MSEAAAKPEVRDQPGRRLFRLGLLLILLDVLIGSTVVGFQLRRWTFDWTEEARFHYDINRNYMFGWDALDQGFLNVYENQVLTDPDEAHKINYAPLRLATFEAWAKWNSWKFADPRDWRPSHDFHAFVMYLNTTLELLASIAALLIVRHWVWRTNPPADPDSLGRLGRFLYGSFRATLAFLLLWFNPAMIANAHGWPTWDMWVIPFFLWALLLACWEWWFLAGIIIGLGAMLKGQQMFVLWMFMLWPLFAGKPGRALRCLCGFGLACALVLSGWMLSVRPDMSKEIRHLNWPAVAWIVSCIAAVVVANLWRILPSGRNWAAIPFGAAALGLIAFPGLSHWSIWSLALIVLALSIIAAGRLLPLRKQGYALAGVVAASLLLCIVFYKASTAWWELGFMYGTERHMGMVIGPGNNLCALLEARFGLSNPQEIVASIPATLTFGHGQIPVHLRHLLAAIFFVLFVISCIPIARMWKLNDRRFLIAAIVPWLLMYSILPQMHERYLLYGCGAGAIVIGCSFGYAALNLFLTILTALQTLHCMMGANGLAYRYGHPVLNPDLSGFCESIRPDVSWAVLTITAVFFFGAFTRSRWRAGTEDTRMLPLPADDLDASARP